MKLVLKPGDVFATRSQMLLGRLINFVQKVWSHDNKSEDSHCGIILDAYGRTFEANWHIEVANISDYADQKVIIARYQDMTLPEFQVAYDIVHQEHNGDLYPFWRLPMFMLPFLAKYIHIMNRPVCSELVAEFLYRAGLRQPCYMGTNVDDLVEEWKNFKGVDVLFEGTLKEVM